MLIRASSTLRWLTFGTLLAACGGRAPSPGATSPAPTTTARIDSRELASNEDDAASVKGTRRAGASGPPAPPSTCPATRNEVRVDALCTGNATCDYGKSRCTCAPSWGCSGVARREPPPNAWSCTDPRVDGCPDAQPDEGAACNHTRECGYGKCGGVVMRCDGRVWRVARHIGPPG